MSEKCQAGDKRGLQTFHGFDVAFGKILADGQADGGLFSGNPPSLENSRLRSLCLLGLNAAGDGIENGIPGLLDRRDGIVDCDARLPLQFFGIILGAFGA